MKQNKTTQLIGHFSHYLIASALITSGILKWVGIEAYREMLMDLSPHYLKNIYLLGIISFISGILLVLPKTFIFGFIASLVFLGGTIAAHMQHGDNYLPQVVFVLILSLAAYLKRPNWFN